MLSSKLFDLRRRVQKLETTFRFDGKLFRNAYLITRVPGCRRYESKIVCVSNKVFQGAKSCVICKSFDVWGVLSEL